MDQREFSRMVQRTNVDDLLGNRIENGSNLKSFARSADADPEVGAAEDAKKESQVDLPTQSPRPPKPVMVEAQKTAPPKDPISYLGLFIGACLAVSGILLFLYPQDVHVLHDRSRGHPFVEHVTTSASQVYAVLALVLGIAIGGLSLYRPKE